MAEKVVELRKTQEEQIAPAVRARHVPRAAAACAAGRGPADRARWAGSISISLSGRYISTDNAFVGAQKVLITPDISGKIARVMVAEGQRVNAGEALLEIDPQPFRISVTQAEARLASMRTEFLNLKTNLASMTRRIALARETPRSQAARRRAQDHAARQPHRLADGHGQCARRRGHGEDAARTA